MKVVILAGGKGSRISEYTHSIPKPMIKIGSKPIIEHIIDIYSAYKLKDFIIAGGYKYKIIEKYFENKKKKKLNIKVINTGLNTLTGLRIKKLKKYLDDKTFLLTYGDGLADIKINKLIKFHKKIKKIVTMTAVHPPARFGELTFNKFNVKSFEEKPQLQKGWINGGFFVINPEIFKVIKNKNAMFEREPIKKLVKMKQIAAYPHKSFWACMDTKRDKDLLNKLAKSKKIPWLKSK